MIYSTCAMTAVGMLCGAILGNTIGAVAVWCVAVVGILLSLFLKSFRWSIIAAVIACIAMNFYYNEKCNTTKHDIYEYIGKYTTVTAKIIAPAEQSNENYIYTVQARSVACDKDGPHSVKEKMRVTSTKKFEFGDTIDFSGYVKEIKSRSGEFNFDSKQYYYEKGIFFSMYANSAVLSDKDIGVHISVVSKIRNYFFEKSFERTSGDRTAIMYAILTGNKSYISDELDSVLTRTGTKRYLYNARIHLFMLVGLIGFLTARMKKRVRDVIMCVVFLLYALINSDKPSFVRVFVVAAVGIVYVKTLGIKCIWDILGISVILCGIVNPLILTDDGFLLGLVAVVEMYCLFPIVRDRIYDIFKFRKITFIISIWLCLTIGLLPFSAYFFNSITPYSVLFTGLYTVLLFIQLICGAVGCITGWGTAFVPIDWFVGLSNLLQKLPLSYILIGKPSILFIILYYTCIAMIVCNKEKRRILICATLGLGTAFVTVKIADINQVYVHFVNVGQGDGQIIHMPYKANIMIDGGGNTQNSTYDYGKYEYIPYATGCGITHINYAFVTHYHGDHVMGIIHALDDYKVDNLYLPDCDPNNEYRMLLEQKAKKQGTRIVYIGKNGRMKIKGANLHIYASDNENENDKSLVIRFSYGEFKLLFTGDITSVREGELLKEKYISADVVKIPHHGSKYSSSDEFIKRVNPKIGVVGSGENNMYNFPTNEVCERYLTNNVGMLNTAKHGDIVVVGNKKGIKRIRLYR